MCYHIVRHAGCHSSPLDGTVNIFLISLITFVSVPSLPGAALSQYLPLLLKLVVVVYAVLCLGELLHRWSSGSRCSLSLVRLSSQQQRCSAVQYWVPTGG